MKRIGGAILAVSLLLGVGVSAMASTRTPYINQRQRNQQSRIRQGIQSGQLTRGEAGRLESREGRIEAQKLEDKASGGVTPAERAQLNRELNRTNHAIYRDKHNDHTRGQ